MKWARRLQTISTKRLIDKGGVNTNDYRTQKNDIRESEEKKNKMAHTGAQTPTYIFSITES
jgi:hypothetical protein